jgi:hypothetical protein
MTDDKDHLRLSDAPGATPEPADNPVRIEPMADSG